MSNGPIRAKAITGLTFEVVQIGTAAAVAIAPVLPSLGAPAFSAPQPSYLAAGDNTEDPVTPDLAQFREPISWVSSGVANAAYPSMTELRPFPSVFRIP